MDERLSSVMSLEEPDRLAYQYLLAEMQGSRTILLALWASILALAILAVGSYPTATWLAAFSGIAAVIAAIFVWRYSNYLGVVKATAKKYAFAPTDTNLVEVIRNEILSREVRME